jgi:hypothetical protein
LRVRALKTNVKRHNPPDKKNGHKLQLVRPAQQIGEVPSLSRASDIELVRLQPGKPNHLLYTAQRQEIAKQIGQLHGNEHLQELMVARQPQDQQATAQPQSTIATQYLKNMDEAMRNKVINEYATQLDWINNLDADLVRQIDGAYSKTSQESSRQAGFLQLLKGDKESNEAINKIKKQLSGKGRKVKTGAVLEKLWQEKPDLKDQWQKYEAPQVKVGTSRQKEFESLFDAPSQPVDWDVARAIPRINFVAKYSSVLGSVDAVKNHFQNVKPYTISGQKMLLYKPAGERLELAVKEFEAAYPGAKFPGTTVAQSLRGRHQHRHGLGKEAHPLGVAIDYDAVQNPHLHEKVQLLETITGGSARMAFISPHGKAYTVGQLWHLISKVGKETASQTPEDQRAPEGKALLAQVKKAYDDVLKTSEAFKNSLGTLEKEKLKSLGQQYWNTYRDQLTKLGSSLAKNQKALSLARKKAQPEILKRLEKEYGPKIKEAKAHAKTNLEQEKLSQKALSAKIEKDPAVVAAQMEMTNALKEQIDKSGGIPDLLTKIDEDQKAHKQISEAITKELTIILEPFTTIIEGKLATLNPAGSPAEKTKHNNLTKLKHTLLTDFPYVFGYEKGETAKAFKGSHHEVVGHPSVLQLLDKGFIKYDPVPTATSKGGGTFNAEFFGIMMKYGWSPLAAGGTVDTMHFDFAEGLIPIRSGVTFGPFGVKP